MAVFKGYSLFVHSKTLILHICRDNLQWYEIQETLFLIGIWPGPYKKCVTLWKTQCRNLKSGVCFLIFYLFIFLTCVLPCIMNVQPKLNSLFPFTTAVLKKNPEFCLIYMLQPIIFINFVSVRKMVLRLNVGPFYKVNFNAGFHPLLDIFW